MAQYHLVVLREAMVLPGLSEHVRRPAEEVCVSRGKEAYCPAVFLGWSKPVSAWLSSRCSGASSGLSGSELRKSFPMAFADSVVARPRPISSTVFSTSKALVVRPTFMMFNSTSGETPESDWVPDRRELARLHGVPFRRAQKQGSAPGIVPICKE